MMKKHPEIVQETLKVKQKLLASHTQTLVNEHGVMTVLHQNNLHNSVDVLRTSENKAVKSPDPLIESSITYHPEEKSDAVTVTENVQVPLEETKTDMGEDTVKKTDSPLPKGMLIYSLHLNQP